MPIVGVYEFWRIVSEKRALDCRVFLHTAVIIEMILAQIRKNFKRKI